LKQSVSKTNCEINSWQYCINLWLVPRPHPEEAVLL